MNFFFHFLSSSGDDLTSLLRRPTVTEYKVTPLCLPQKGGGGGGGGLAEPPGHLEVEDANRGAKVSGATCVLEVSRLCILEGSREHTCPLELSHPGKMKGGSGVAVEVAVGEKAICRGRRAGCALPKRRKEKLMEWDTQPRANSAGHPERESRGGQASCRQPPRA